MFPKKLILFLLVVLAVAMAIYAIFLGGGLLFKFF